GHVGAQLGRWITPVIGERVLVQKILRADGVAKELFLLLLSRDGLWIGLFVTVAARAVEGKQFRSPGELALILGFSLPGSLRVGGCLNGLVEVRGAIRHQIGGQAAVAPPGFAPILAELLLAVF